MSLTSWKPAALAATLALAGCAADPLANVPRLSDVALSEPASMVEALAAPEETSDKIGFFQRLIRKREVAPAAPDASVPPAPASVAASRDTAAADTAPAEGEAGSQPGAAESPPRRGLAALFGKHKPPTASRSGADDAKLEPAALRQPEADAANPAAPAARPGLFGRLKAGGATRPRHGGLALRDVAPGEVLPFGEIARACHVKRPEMGEEVAKYPERGAKYRVYDSAPGNLGLHNFYLTGFADGCPRQVSAALAVFGTAEMYEALRYGLPVKARSKKPTDKAYEKVKSRLCGVSRNQPCGKRITRLEKHTVFLSLYDRFEDARGWSNLLLSDGEVMAKDIDD